VIRRLLSALVKARLVTAQKGATGGFSLACAPEEISLLDIYRAVHAQPSPALRHFAPNQLCPVGARIETIIGDLFAKAQASMEAELARATLSGINHQVQHACAAK
jgi:DNA-binding IscR family transcriptional regulator